jgi:hypothetical protein
MYLIPMRRGLRLSGFLLLGEWEFHCNPFRLRLVLNLALATVVGLNGTLVEAKQKSETLEYVYFSFNKCPI